MAGIKCVEINVFFERAVPFDEGLIYFFLRVSTSLSADLSYLFLLCGGGCGRRRVHTVPVSPSLNFYAPPSLLSFRVRDK